MYYENVHAAHYQTLMQFRATHPLQQQVIDGQEWRYIDTLSGDSTLLILVGGLRVADAAFQAIIQLEDSFRILAPTYPPLNTIGELADGLADMLDAADIEKTSVLAGSFGGMIAQVFAHRHPERVEHMVLSSTGVPDIERYRRMSWLMTLTPGPLVRWQAKKMLFDLMQPPANQAAFWRAYLNELFSERLEKRDILSTLHCIIDYATNYADTSWQGKVLILQAADDAAFDADARQNLQQRYPTAQLHVFDEGGHSPSMTWPDEYFGVVRRFLLTD